MNQVLAYNPTLDPVQLTTHFVDGLKPDVRAVVMLQRPPDLDTACVLATLQEEVTGMDGVRSREYRRPELVTTARPQQQAAGRSLFHRHHVWLRHLPWRIAAASKGLAQQHRLTRWAP